MSNERKVIDLQRLQRFKEHLQDFGRETEPFIYLFGGRTSLSDRKLIYHRAELHIGRPIVWINESAPVFVDTKFVSSATIQFSGISQGKLYQWTIDSNGLFVSIVNGLPLPVVVDNLTTTDATKALSANQGKVLKSLIDNASIEAKYFMFDLLPVRGSGNPVISDGLYTMKQDLQGQIDDINAVLEDNVLTMEVDDTGAILVTTGENSGFDALQSGIDPITGLVKLVYNVA